MAGVVAVDIELAETLGGSVPPQGLAGPGVEEEGDLVQLGLGVDGQVAALGQ